MARVAVDLLKPLVQCRQRVQGCLRLPVQVPYFTVCFSLTCVSIFGFSGALRA